MKKFLLVFCAVLFLAGCSATLPDRSQDISEFVPSPEVVATGSQIFEFSTKFPQSCEWVELERVVDGDTIKISENVSVRMLGIDTPETVHPRKPVEKWGPEASAWMKEILADDEKVCLIGDELNDKLDKYGRRLAYVFDEAGHDLSAELLESGLARGYFYFPFERKDEFKKLESEAKTAAVGIWSD
ncbi:lipoprotein [bacterium]|jgi:micrococcal nuclease|nr:lipoprotein [bacterium]MBT6832284.1 lipoprotein [bacterium]MBT6996221.1 lipoprotein [bacterium]MBT7772468.1 lipoprotein [bacterium]